MTLKDLKNTLANGQRTTDACLKTLRGISMDLKRLISERDKAALAVIQAAQQLAANPVDIDGGIEKLNRLQNRLAILTKDAFARMDDYDAALRPLADLCGAALAVVPAILEMEKCFFQLDTAAQQALNEAALKCNWKLSPVPQP